MENTSEKTQITTENSDPKKEKKRLKALKPLQKLKALKPSQKIMLIAAGVFFSGGNSIDVGVNCPQQ